MTKSQRAFHEYIRDAGCVVCMIFHHVHSPCDIHHILSGGRRMGEDHVLGLCPIHHRSGRNDEQAVSRHPWLSEFQRRYGTEMELLAMVRERYESKKAA